MAFYTSRVDKDGNELERRHSERSILPLLSAASTYVNRASARSIDTNSSIRYLNSASFIEKTEESDISSPCTDLKPQSSQCFEVQSNIVPSLDLQSEENYPNTNEYTFSCRKTVLNPDNAFDTWLSAKRKVMSDEAARRKKIEDQKRREQEERKRISEEKFQKWVEAKKATTVHQRGKTNQEQQEDNEFRTQNSEGETRVCIEEWERKKRLEEERRRMMKRREEQQRREVEQQRSQLSSEAWNKWLAESSNKPKPVPLNRGIFTLRGTISDIYVNPNEWKSISSEQEQE